MILSLTYFTGRKIETMREKGFFPSSIKEVAK
jgi:hypothetical protein